MSTFQDYLSHFSRFFNQYLPLTNPVLILALTLLIILFAPLLFRRFKIPGVIGLVLAGVFIGPKCLHIIQSTDSFELLSKTGLLYIMFLAGLEIDMQEFNNNRNKSLIFGALTFFIPIVAGYFVCIYVFHFSLWSALLLASMFSTHTLLSYPIVSNMGIIKNRAVQVTFGGTIITDSAVLILLGIITNAVNGEISSAFFIRIIISLALLVFSTLYLLPRVSRWFFRNIEAQASSHYIFVLAVVFISGFLSELAGVEPIIGAFLAGLGLSKVIPHSSILMNRIVFIGNTLFIPFFLISAGMLVDLALFFKGSEALIFAGILCVVGIFSKYIAAWFTAIICKYTKHERNIIFGLSVSHAAATLAIIKVGFDIGLFDQNVVNATIILILISCLVSSFVTERAARKIAVQEKEVVRKTSGDKPERILIPVSNPENIQRLIDLALLIKDQTSHEPLYPLSIVEDEEDAGEKINLVKKVVEGVAEQIASGDKKVEVLKKVDLSIVDGIVRTAKAYAISDILLSYKAQHSLSPLISSSVSENILAKAKQTVIISKILQPLNSFKKIVLVLTPNAELRSNFGRSANQINTLLKQLGNDVVIYGYGLTLKSFADAVNDKKQSFYRYIPVVSFENHEPVTPVQEDCLYIFLSARAQTVSFNYHVDEMPKQLSRNNEFTSFLTIYPEVSKALQDSRSGDITGNSVEQQLVKVKKITGKITGIFKKEEEEQEQEVEEEDDENS
ncbi:MAG: cation:proton antiporter [Bacteroidetes bacterium]|nr:cation:proton antiporter [Bacteroidota bacterium]